MTTCQAHKSGAIETIANPWTKIAHSVRENRRDAVVQKTSFAISAGYHQAKEPLR
jgi:hypothetical protein